MNRGRGVSKSRPSIERVPGFVSEVLPHWFTMSSSATPDTVVKNSGLRRERQSDSSHRMACNGRDLSFWGKSQGYAVPFFFFLFTFTNPRHIHLVQLLNQHCVLYTMGILSFYTFIPLLYTFTERDPRLFCLSLGFQATRL